MGQSPKDHALGWAVETVDDKEIQIFFRSPGDTGRHVKDLRQGRGRINRHRYPAELTPIVQEPRSTATSLFGKDLSFIASTTVPS